MCATPLHRQVMLDRKIIVTEQADLHLLWQESRMFLKPLLDFLLGRNFWTNHLRKSQNLHESATGLLLIEVWLVCHKNDLKFAQDRGLLSSNISWEGWTAFVGSRLHYIDHTGLSGINSRYQFGELGLSRLNWIYQLSSVTQRALGLSRAWLAG